MSLGFIEREWKTSNTAERECFRPAPETDALPHVDLITCNRSVRFFWSDDPSHDDNPLRHLFRITAGLESMAVGEAQVLGQVRRAFAAAKIAGHTCTELDDIFDAAIATAKRIHREIDFTLLPPDICSLALDFAARRLGNLKGKRILIIGAGRTASLAARICRDRGAAEIAVCNRSPERVRKIAAEIPIRAIDYPSRYGEAARADLVISATSSPHLVLEASPLPPCNTTFLDLAFPPDIDPSLPRRIGLDDLATNQNPLTNPDALANAEALIDRGISTLLKHLRPAESSTYLIGTRGSKLALIQAEFVRDHLANAYPDDRFEIKIISTAGDRITDRPISEIGGNAVFSHELERALLDGTIDLAVHSMKDLAATTPPGLALAKAWPREDPRDVLVSRDGRTLADLPAGSRIGTGSVRRTALLKNFRPDLIPCPLRGNVDTRLRKLFEPAADETPLDAIILAAAGLKRLGRAEVITEYFDPTVWIPAANQGQLAIELRAGDRTLREKLDALGDDNAELVAIAERGFLAELNADCHQPVGAYALLENGQPKLHCLYGRDNLPLLFTDGANAVRRRLAGIVALVGAGPGDPKLITVKALDFIRKANCIVYDRLVSADLLKEAPANCELVYVGKVSHSHTLPQDRINALLADRALAHPLVVRLKGGDPFVFGRGGEEAAYLRERGIRVEIVPGVSSAIAAPAEANIPITKRGVANSFRVIAAHASNDSPTAINFASMTDPRETLVFLMGLAALPRIVDALISIAKRDPSTPIAVIAAATTPSRRFVFGSLADIVARVSAANLEPPATIVVGPTVRLRPPLVGKRLLMPVIGSPRPEHLALLQSTGAIVDTIRVGEIVPAESEPIEDADWLIITSRNAVTELSQRLMRPVRCKIAAVGPRTAAALAEAGFITNLVGNGNADDLEAQLKPTLGKGERVIHFKPYQNRPVDLEPIDLGRYDAAIFTAASSRERILAVAQGSTLCLSLGPSSETYTFEDLIELTIKSLTERT